MRQLVTAGLLIPRWLESVLFVMLLWSLAGLFWQLAAPTVQHGHLAMPELAPADPGWQPDNLQQWFLPPAGISDVPVTDISLLAVVSGAKGLAVLRVANASSVAVRVGEDVRPGTRLVAVDASGIVIERAAQRSRLLLPQAVLRGASIVPHVERDAQAISTHDSEQPAGTPAREGETITLSRGQLSGMLEGTNLVGWDKGLASYRDGGIAVEAAAEQVLAKVLFLRDGDVIQSANGKAVRELADISLVYNQLSQQPSVELSVLRDGSLQTLHYKIQP